MINTYTGYHRFFISTLLKAVALPVRTFSAAAFSGILFILDIDIRLTLIWANVFLIEEGSFRLLHSEVPIFFENVVLELKFRLKTFPGRFFLFLLT